MRRNLVATVVVGAVIVIVATMPVGLPVRIATAVTGAALVAAAVVDVVQRRLPNRLVTLAAVAPLVVGALPGTGTGVGVVVLGGVLAASPMLVVHVRRGVGMGDVKAAAAIGASCAVMSLWAAPAAIAVAAVIAAGHGVVRRRRTLPLGPSLCAGWMVAVAAAGWSS